MANFKDRTHEQPIMTAVIMLLFALSCIFCPTGFLGASLNARLLAAALVRFVFSGLGIFFIIKLGLWKCLKIRLENFKAFDVLIIAFLVAMNNFPFLPFIQKTVTVSTNALTGFLFVLQCFSVGLFEEIFFRGLIFLLLLCYFPDTKRGQFLAILVSSLLFGLTHLANLFGGAGLLPVLLQIGYSAAIGAMMSVVLLYGRSLWFCVLFHSLFDVGGLMIDTLGSGEIWTVPNIVLTAVVSAAAVIYLSWRFIKGKKNAPLLPRTASETANIFHGEGNASVLLSQSDVENHHDEESDNTPDDR